jgi:hypothetical protein
MLPWRWSCEKAYQARRRRETARHQRHERDIRAAEDTGYHGAGVSTILIDSELAM